METDDEIRGKAYVHWKAWHETYPGLVSEAYLAGLTLESMEEKAFRWLDNILVAKEGERVVGFVGFGAAGDALPGTGEIFALCGDDPLCARLTDIAASALATLIMDLVRFCDPDCVVLGGGVVADGFLLSRAEEKLNRHTMRYVSGGVRLTDLDGRRIGLLGAACGAMEGKEGAL